MTSYDEVPYPSLPRPQTHPNHLAALATLFGLKPVPVTRCRVLDIGCADGSNLIPMACQLPESQFVGLDLSPRQIAAGQAKATTLGLKNLTLQAMNLLDVTEDLGQFDYIIVYGVYTWVPAEVQHKILQICRHHLAPHGVAYISYNVYPGWHMHGLARDLMRYQTRRLAAPEARVKQARNLLDFMTETVPGLSSNLSDALQANQLIFKSLRDLLQDQPDEYLLHDHLEAINEPLYLHQFVEQAEQNGLQYLTDAETSALITNYLPPHLARQLEQMASSRVELEQLMDFLYVRAFRQTLLCRQEVVLRPDIQPESLLGLHVAASLQPVNGSPNLKLAVPEKFRSSIGVTLTTQQPLNKAALLYLAEIWPQAAPFERVLTEARARLDPTEPPVYSAARQAQEVKTLGELLLKGYALNMVELHACSANFSLAISDYPTASPLARFEASQGNKVTNQRHEPVLMDETDLGYYLLPYLDGRHSQADLLAHLRTLVAQGVLLESDGQTGDESLGQALAHTLGRLAAEALLVG